MSGCGCAARSTPSRCTTVAGAQGDGHLEAVTVEDETPPLTRAELEAWRQNLKGLALRFRESLTEW